MMILIRNIRAIGMLYFIIPFILFYLFELALYLKIIIKNKSFIYLFSIYFLFSFKIFLIYIMDISTEIYIFTYRQKYLNRKYSRLRKIL